jgi:hypothetical protein
MMRLPVTQGWTIVIIISAVMGVVEYLRFSFVIGASVIIVGRRLLPRLVRLRCIFFWRAAIFGWMAFKSGLYSPEFLAS